VLELLSCSLLVAICDGLVVDFDHVGESVHDESSQQHGVAHLILFNRQTNQIRQRLQLADLNETVDVVVLEEKALKFLEALQFGDVRDADDVIEADVLERNLLHGFLELRVVQNFESVSVNEKFVVAFDLGVTALDEAVRARLLPALVPVQAQTLDPVHFIFPLLTDHLEQAFW